MNLLVKLSIVPIFFVPLIAGWAGTQEEAKVVEQPSVKTTEPWRKSRLGVPAGWPGSAAPLVFTASTPTSVSGSGRFSDISTLFIRSAAKLEEGALVYWVTFST